VRVLLFAFLSAFVAAPIVGGFRLIFYLTVLGVGALVLARILNRPTARAESAEPTFASATDAYLTALENDEDRWVPAGAGTETPFRFGGRRYLKVINHHLDDIGYADLATGKITTKIGEGEEIAQVRVKITDKTQKNGTEDGK
jgi:hypothetical protein